MAVLAPIAKKKPGRPNYGCDCTQVAREMVRAGLDGLAAVIRADHRANRAHVER